MSLSKWRSLLLTYYFEFLRNKFKNIFRLFNKPRCKFWIVDVFAAVSNWNSKIVPKIEPQFPHCCQKRAKIDFWGDITWSSLICLVIVFNEFFKKQSQVSNPSFWHDFSAILTFHQHASIQMKFIQLSSKRTVLYYALETPLKSQTYVSILIYLCKSPAGFVPYMIISNLKQKIHGFFFKPEIMACYFHFRFSVTLSGFCAEKANIRNFYY